MKKNKTIEVSSGNLYPLLFHISQNKSANIYIQKEIFEN